MKKNIFMRAAAAGIALMMLFALAPGMGLANASMTFGVIYHSNTPGLQAPKIDTAMGNYIVRNNPFSNPGYTFNGWDTQANGTGTRYAPGVAIIVNEPLLLYAQWKSAAADTVTITYKANLGDNQADVTDTVTKGSVYTLKATPFANPRTHTFVGWNTQANGSGTTYQPGKTLTANGSHTLYAQWKIVTAPTTVNIAYKANLGDSQFDVADTVIKDSSYTIKNYQFTVIAIYTFLGWNTQPNGSGTAYYPEQAITANSDLTLYAQWRIVDSQTVTITYKINIEGDGQPDVRATATKGSAYKLIANPFIARTGYLFDGWNTQANGTGTAYKPGQKLTANDNYTLYAQWKIMPIRFFTITYIANAGSSQADVIYTFDINKGYGELMNNPFTRPGYIFTGWNTQPNGSGTSYQPGQTVTANMDYTLYAQWKVVDSQTVTITYKCDGQPDVKDTVTKDSYYTIKPYPYMMIAIYTFLGWNTMANGTGIMYNPGQTITANANLTLYAQWRLL